MHKKFEQLLSGTFFCRQHFAANFFFAANEMGQQLSQPNFDYVNEYGHKNYGCSECCGLPQKGKMACPQCAHFIGTNSHSCKFCSYTFKERPQVKSKIVKTNLPPHHEPYGAKCETCLKMTGRGSKSCSNCGHLNSCARRNCEWCYYKVEKKIISKTQKKPKAVEFDDSDLFQHDDYGDNAMSASPNYSDEEIDSEIMATMGENSGDTLMDFCNIPIGSFFE